MERLTRDEFRALQAEQPKRQKYGAKATFRCAHCEAVPRAKGRPCWQCGETAVMRFDSKAEARRYDELRGLERAGFVEGVRRQVPYPITVGEVTVGKYVADFVYRSLTTGLEIVEDVKSEATHTPLSRFKIRCVEAQYGIKVTIVGK